MNASTATHTSSPLPHWLGPALLWLMLLSTFAIAGCARPVMMPGSAERGFIIFGYVTHSDDTVVIGESVYLMDQTRDELLSTIKTDAFGTFSFSYYPPGEYRLETGEVEHVFELRNADTQVNLIWLN